MNNIIELINQSKYNHQNGNLREAERIYLQILKDYPDNHDICQFLGIAYSQMNNHDNAVFYLKKATELQPTNTNYLINLGEALARKGEIKESINNFYKAIELAPNLAEIHINLASVLKKDKNYQKAVEHYKQAIIINPNNPNVYNLLGLTYIEHLLFAEAVTTFTALIKIDPNFPNAKDNLASALQMSASDNMRINSFKKFDTFENIEQKFDSNDLIHSYLILLKKCLTDTLRLKDGANELDRIKEGLTWPLYAETMIGIKRLNNLHYCLSEVIKNNIEGDFIETGVWRGGATILMSGILKAYGIENRNVWVADSFDGLPQPNMKYKYDVNSNFHTMQPLKVTIDDVKNNFRKYNLLNEQVKFLKGWFKDTLPTAPIEKLAILRLDGDMYESTIDALNNLYPKLSVGGYIIIDDYGAIEACLRAVEDYRKEYNISEEIHRVDHSGVYWIKER